MERETWRRLGDIFVRAVELPAAERPAYLEAVCGGDSALLAELTAMLEGHGEGGSAPGGLWVSGGTRPPALQVGSTIGSYRLDALLGRGGMGEVFRATRVDDQFQEQVAIKVVRPERATPDLVRRFLQERQIMARLRHPNIATLFDGGLASGGQPYLVMELVDGTPITEYVRQRNLPIADILRLFVTVCQAVQFAHQHLVVHRDLKPSNILVGADGRVRLLDFGIAKPLDEASTTGDFLLLTPEHAAPEQFLGNPITTATDVYALGVLLYDLLAGVRPFQHVPPVEVARAVCEETPKPPSWHRPVATDLDHIALMALNKEPERRYPSAGDLAADIANYLAGHPVKARQATWGYRARRFVRRHRTPLGATAVFVVLGLVTAAWAGLRVARERDIAERERDKARETTKFLTEMLDAAAPSRALGDSMTVQEALAQSTARLETDTIKSPELREELLFTVGKTYHELGEYQKAETLLTKAYHLGRSLHRERDTTTLITAEHLAVTLRVQGRHDTAERTLRGLIDRYGDLGAGDALRTASAANSLGEVLYLQGKYQEAVAAFRRSLDIGRRRGAKRIDIALTLNNLGVALGRVPYPDSAALAQAQSALREALELYQQASGESHPGTLRTMMNLAVALRDAGRADDAVPLLEKSLAIRRRVLGPVHPAVGDGLMALGHVYLIKRQWVTAESLFRAAIEVNTKALGPNHGEIGMDLMALSRALIGRQATAEAVEAGTRAVVILDAALGPEHPSTVTSRGTLGGTLLEAGRFRESESVLRRAHQSRLKAFGEKHPLTLRVQVDLGYALGRQGRLREAKVLLEEADAMWPAKLPTADSTARANGRRYLEEIRGKLGSS